MSEPEQRVKHSRRISKKRSATLKQVKIAQAHGITVKEYHRYAKHHAMNCGRPHCLLCTNPRRTWGEKTMQEKRFEQQLQETQAPSDKDD